MGWGLKGCSLEVECWWGFHLPSITADMALSEPQLLQAMRNCLMPRLWLFTWRYAPVPTQCHDTPDLLNS